MIPQQRSHHEPPFEPPFTDWVEGMNAYRLFRTRHGATGAAELKILVAAGPSPESIAATELALQFADDCPGVRFQFCHVVDIAGAITHWDRGLGDYALPFEEARRQARHVAKRFSDKAEDHGVHAGVDVRYGDVADEIVDLAVDRASDLIVVGNGRASKINRFLNGSILERIVRRSRVPVFVGRGESDLQPFRPRRILVPAADVRGSRSAVAFAERIAEFAGGEVILMRAASSQDAEMRAIARFVDHLQPDVIVTARPPADAWNRFVKDDVLDRLMAEIDVPLIVTGA